MHNLNILGLLFIDDDFGRNIFGDVFKGFEFFQNGEKFRVYLGRFEMMLMFVGVHHPKDLIAAESIEPLAFELFDQIGKGLLKVSICLPH